MNIPRLASDNHHFMLILFLMFIVLGIHAFFTMPRTEDPPITLPGASIVIVLPGADPEDLEELIVTPVEEAIHELEDIKRIETTTRDGMVYCSVEFIFGTDEKEKFSEVVQQINAIRSKLPEEIYELAVSRWSSSDVNVLQLAFVSDSATYRTLEEEALKLKRRIEQISGIRSVDLCGIPEQEIRIALDPVKMAFMNVSLDQVGAAIVSNNLNIPGGSIRADDIKLNIRTSGSYQNLEEVRNTAVGSWQGNLIFLEDVASVDYGYEDPTWITRFNGRRSVFLTVKQKEDINLLRLRKEIQEAVTMSKEKLPEGISLETVFDQTDSVRERVNGFLGNLAQGMILVGIIIFFSLGFRVSLLVMLAVPVSTIIGIGWVDMAGFGLQQISVAALVIVLGMLVDNSIVITQNMERFIRKGIAPVTASIEATSQLSLAVISSTLTTQLAFIPIMMMPDKAGKFIQSLPVTVILTLLASLLVSLVLTPYLGGIFLRAPSGRQRLLFLRRFLDRIIEGPYSRMLEYSIRNPRRVLFISVVVFLASLALAMTIGVSFFPKAQKNQFLIRITTPEQSDIQATDKAARIVERMLDTIPLVKRYATNVGHGNPRIYYNLVPKLFQSNFAEIYVELSAYRVREFDALIGNLRHSFSRITSARIEIKELEQGAPIEAPVAVKITGDDLGTLQTIAGQIENEFHQVGGLVNIDNQTSRISTDLKVSINRDKAAMFGVAVSDIDRSIRAYVAGTPVSEYHDEEGKVYDIVLRIRQGDTLSVGDLAEIYVRSQQNRYIPLSQLAAISFEPSRGIISHFDLRRCATVTADIQKGYYLDGVIGELTPWLEAYPWPDGYGYRFTGELESRQESFGGMFRALMVAAMLILALLVLQFRSLKQSLIIFSAVPMAVTGALIALFLTGNPFSFTAFVGAVSLVGIVVNNSIILVDYTNKLVSAGRPAREALMEAGKTRFTPILLTALTTVGGLLPLTIGGGTLWAPMGWTIIGGLTLSTLLTLIIVPVLYLLYE